MSPVVARIANDPISAESVAQALCRPDSGAQLVFCGVVRNRNEGRPVVAVTYDAHLPLAEKTFLEIGTEACAHWGAGLSVAVVHRVGRLSVGEVSVVIGVASPHRDVAYEASRYVIEQVKVRSPVWKQEHYADGDSEWLKGHSLRGDGSTA
jgi:molybdopterin synthase catalytic subunit